MKKPRSNLHLHGTRKIGCHASIHVQKYIIYTDYKVTSDTSNKWQQSKTQEQMLHNLRRDQLDGKTIKTADNQVFVSLGPSEEAYHKSHQGIHVHVTPSDCIRLVVGRSSANATIAYLNYRTHTMAEHISPVRA